MWKWKNNKNKKEKVKENKRENNHHLVQKIEKKKFNISMPENIHRMNEFRHRALHALFLNLTTPKQQFEFMSELCKNILSDEAKELLQNFLDLDDYDFYIQWLRKWKKKTKKW